MPPVIHDACWRSVAVLTPPRYWSYVSCGSPSFDASDLATRYSHVEAIAATPVADVATMAGIRDGSLWTTTIGGLSGMRTRRMRVDTGSRDRASTCWAFVVKPSARTVSVSVPNGTHTTRVPTNVSSVSNADALTT